MSRQVARLGACFTAVWALLDWVREGGAKRCGNVVECSHDLAGVAGSIHRAEEGAGKGACHSAIVCRCRCTQVESFPLRVEY